MLVKIVSLGFCIMSTAGSLVAQNLPAVTPQTKPLRLDSRLWDISSRVAKRAMLPRGITINEDGKILVIVEPEYGKGASSVDHEQLVQTGAKILDESRHLIRIAVPPERIVDVTKVKGVSLVRPPMKPTSNVTSQGANLLRVPVTAARGVKGAGVKVAIIDRGFKRANMLSRDMPRTWQYFDYSDDGIYEGDEAHGTAIAEIIYDIAPEATLYLLKTSDFLDFEQAVDLCVKEDIDIINYSASWLAAGFGDGTGPACDIVNEATEKGILWVNSAGNYAKSMYSGRWSSPDSDGWHNFSSNIEDEVMGLKQVKIGDTIEIVLTWNDWPRSFQDYDLFLYRTDSNRELHRVAASETRQLGNAPSEHIEFEVTVSGDYGITVLKAANARVAEIKVLSSFHELDYSSGSTGTIGVPADSRGSFSVGAIQHWQWGRNTIADYSSQGPTFDGRVKPDIVAPSGVSTASYGTNGFSGTSAAAPHVAGVAALIKSANPSYTRDQLVNTLESSAVDVGARGKDNTYGYGKLAIPFLQSTTAPAITSISPSSGVKYRDIISIRGSGFGSTRGSNKVVFLDSQEPQSSDYISWTDTSIRVRVPVGAQSGAVTVVTSSGTSNVRVLLITSPWLGSLSSTRAKSGDIITIQGANFQSVRGTGRVYFGSVAAISYVNWGNQRIRVRVPQDSRTGSVSVRTAVGNSNTQAITILSPYITRASPLTVKPGDQIDISGGNFGITRGTGYVSIGASRLTNSYYKTWSVRAIQIEVPNNVRSGSLKVVTANGESGTRSITIEEPQTLTLPHRGSVGYNPPSVTAHPKTVSFEFEGVNQTVIVTLEARHWSVGEIQLWVNGKLYSRGPGSLGWGSWFWFLQNSSLRSGTNTIEFRNVTNTSRSSNYATWEIRNLQVWKPFSSKMAVDLSAYTTVTPAALGLPYPTPFNAEVSVPFIVGQESLVKISIYDLLGQKIIDLIDEIYRPGYHIAHWNGRDSGGQIVGSGLYLIHMQVGDFEDKSRTILIR